MGMKRKAKRPEFTIPSSPSGGQGKPATVGNASRTLLVAQIVSQVVGALTLAVLYRLLHPADYGLMAAVAPWVMLPRMAATLGLAAALVQLRQPSETLLAKLFRVQLRWGGLAATASVVTMPLVAWLWKEDRLLWIGAALGASSFLAALANLHLARLEKEMRMGDNAKTRIGGLLCGSAAGVLAATLGLGVWALVIQQVAELLVIAVMALAICQWRPWAGKSPTTEAEEVAVLAEATQATQRFGLFYSASQLVNYVGQNIPSVLIPLLVGEAAAELLGLYGQASGWVMRIVFLVTMPLGSVALSALSQTTAGSGPFAVLTGRFFRLTAILLFPAAMGLWSVSTLLMRLLGGAEWSDAGNLLMILAPAAIGLGLMNLMTPILSAAGHARLLLWHTGISTLLATQGMLAGYFFARLQSAGGLPQDALVMQGEGIAYGYTLATLVVITIPYLWFGLRSCGVSPMPVLQTCLRPLRSSSLMAVSVWTLVGWLEKTWPANTAAVAAGELLLAVSLGASIYLLLAREDLRWAYRVLVAGQSFLSED